MHLSYSLLEISQPLTLVDGDDNSESWHLREMQNDKQEQPPAKTWSQETIKLRVGLRASGLSSDGRFAANISLPLMR